MSPSTETARRYVWVDALRRWVVMHEPGPAQFTMCGILMRGSGHTILAREAEKLQGQRCPRGCFDPQQLPNAKYRTK